MSALQQHSIGTIDVVVVNLYPFRQTVTAAHAPTYDVAVENIDIGEVSESMALQPPSTSLNLAGSSVLPAAKGSSESLTGISTIPATRTGGIPMAPISLRQSCMALATTQTAAPETAAHSSAVQAAQP